MTKAFFHFIPLTDHVHRKLAYSYPEQLLFQSSIRYDYMSTAPETIKIKELINIYPLCVATRAWQKGTLKLSSSGDITGDKMFNMFFSLDPCQRQTAFLALTSALAEDIWNFKSPCSGVGGWYHLS